MTSKNLSTSIRSRLCILVLTGMCKKGEGAGVCPPPLGSAPSIVNKKCYCNSCSCFCSCSQFYSKNNYICFIQACDSSNTPIPSTSLLTEVKKIFLPFFNIFGVYYFVNPAKERKFIICTSEEAKEKLPLRPERISRNYKDYLINVSILILNTVIFVHLISYLNTMKNTINFKE